MDNQTAEDNIRDISSFVIEGCMLPLISLPGIIGNIVCLFVLSSKAVDLQPSFANILKCLSCWDIIFLTGVNLIFCLPHHSSTYSSRVLPHMVPIALPLTQIALTGSLYTVVAVALERYYSICKPFKTNYADSKNGLVVIIIIVVVSFVYNITKFFEFETVPRYEIVQSANDNEIENLTESRSEDWMVQLTDLRLNPVYFNAYVVCNTLVMGLVPLVLLTFLHLRIVSAVKLATRWQTRNSNNINIRSLERRDRAMAALLSGVVIVLIICHTPKMIINIFDCFQMFVYGESNVSHWAHVVTMLSHLLLALSSSLNFIIYSFKYAKFRTVVLTGNCSSATSNTSKIEEDIC